MTPRERRERLSSAADAVRSSRLETALVEARAVAESNPQDIVSIGFLGALYAEIGLRDRARHWLNRALELDPANPLALQQIARIDAESASEGSA